MKTTSTYSDAINALQAYLQRKPVIGFFIRQVAPRQVNLYDARGVHCFTVENQRIIGYCGYAQGAKILAPQAVMRYNKQVESASVIQPVMVQLQLL